MQDLRRVSVIAIVLIVAVRLSIGWQLLYEGLWKINSQQTARPWSAEGYLKNAQGPFRNYFRNMTGDPDDLSWLDYDAVAARWDAWHSRFLAHYADMADAQKARLNNLLNGPSSFAVSLPKLPEGVQFGGSLGRVVSYDANRGLLIADGHKHLLPAERDRLLALVAVKQNPAPEEAEQNKIAADYVRAVNDLFQRASRLSIKEQARVLLKEDPERVSIIREEFKGTVDYKRLGEIELYKSLLERYEKNLAAARTNFQFDHLQKQWSEIQQKRSELVGPVKALDDELKAKAAQLLTPAQLARGPVPAPRTKLDSINLQTMWGLSILGILLIAGLFTRTAAIGGAVMLTMFYLAMPPWPGVPEAPGPEHSFIVNKNFIEVMILLAIAALPTGQWFGIDAWIRSLARLLRSRRADRPAPAGEKAASSPAPQPAATSAG